MGKRCVCGGVCVGVGGCLLCPRHRELCPGVGWSRCAGPSGLVVTWLLAPAEPAPLSSCSWHCLVVRSREPQEILQEKKKNNNPKVPLKENKHWQVRSYNWIRSLSDLPICGGASSPGAAQSQSVRPGGAVCSSAGVPAYRGDLTFID